MAQARKWRGRLLGALAALALVGPAQAQTPLKVGFLKTYGLLPMFQAQAKGYFKHKKPAHTTSAFIGGFSDASQPHYHYIDGVTRD